MGLLPLPWPDAIELGLVQRVRSNDVIDLP